MKYSLAKVYLGSLSIEKLLGSWDFKREMRAVQIRGIEENYFEARSHPQLSREMPANAVSSLNVIAF